MAELSEGSDGAVDDVLRIQALGVFRVAVGKRELDEQTWGLRKASALVKLLALTPGHRLHRERVIDALWPELPLTAGNNSLHRTLHAARRALEPHRQAGAAARYLALRGDVLSLGPVGSVEVDADAFREAVAAAHQSHDTAAFRRAIALYGGDLLPDDLYDDWTTATREELRELYVTLLAEAAQHFAAAGSADAAIQTLRRLVAVEPTREDAHVALMRLLARGGRRYDALRQYQQLRAILRDELGAEPEATIRHLYEAIQSGTFASTQNTASVPAATGDRSAVAGAASEEPVAVLATDGTPRDRGYTVEAANGLAQDVVSGHAPASSLSASLAGYVTSFVGREREREHLSDLLAANRLVTVVGAGGSGKTRLALHTAEHLRRDYADGVALVELGALGDATLVPQAVALALGIREQTDRRLIETLAAALAPGKLLLVLDNCEHLRASCAQLADRLLTACPRLRILATSRRPLGLGGEATYRLRPLSAPDPNALPPYAALLEYDAIRLFVERAAASRPGVALTPQNAEAVVRICHRLDGLPLAIELAAGRRRVLTATQIAARLDDALALLGGGPDEVPRHATLRAAIAWSWELLSEPERTLLRRLAVFAGGWTLDAAEAVCAGEGLERTEVLDLLALLVERSQVTVVERDETLRYRLLETIGQYAAAHLREAGEEEALRRRHAHWLQEFVTAAEAGVQGSQQGHWLARLDAERDNLRGALEWACGAGEVELAGAIAGPAARYWYLRGTLHEGQRWLQRILALDDASGHAAQEAVRARVLRESGVLALYQGDHVRATVSCEESLRLFRASGDRLGINVSLSVLAGVAEVRGDYRHAADLMVECLDLAREMGDPDRIMLSLSNLADELVPLGELARARDLYAESLALAERAGNRHRLAMALTNLGKIALRQGDSAAAEESLERALTIMRALEIPRGAAEALMPLGELAMARGAIGMAVARYREALDEYQRADAGLEVAQALEGVSRALAAGGQGALAAHLLGAAEALRARLDTPRSPEEAARHREVVAALRTQLGDAEFEDALATGREQPIEQVVAALRAESAAPEAAEEHRAVEALAQPQQRSGRRGIHQTSPLLSAREREIAELVAAGLTNREIAVRLQIAPRTADTHVANMLAKLDLRSRAEVGPWLRAHMSAE